eukprot:1560898-Prymnesium_polylepis.1
MEAAFHNEVLVSPRISRPRAAARGPRRRPSTQRYATSSGPTFKLSLTLPDQSHDRPRLSPLPICLP